MLRAMLTIGAPVCRPGRLSSVRCISGYGQNFKKPDQPCAKLNNGEHIPLLGLGTWKMTPEQAGPAVAQSLDIGYRHLDLADAYGNHEAIGQTLSKKLGKGGLPREEVWITTKLFNGDHRSPDVSKACKRVLKELQLDYLDLYLMHWPCVTGCKGDKLDPPFEETYMAMEGLVDAGLVRTLGISNFGSEKTQRAIQNARIDPSVNQCELHPYWRNDLLLQYCNSMNVHMTAYSPVGTPDSAEMMKRGNMPEGLRFQEVLKDPTVAAVAKEVGKTPGQVLLRWGLQRGTSVIPKTTRPERLQENFDILKFELNTEQMEKLSTLDYQARYVIGTFVLDKEGPYKNVDELWDSEASDLTRKQAEHLMANA